jgi:hypothetical protein
MESQTIVEYETIEPVTNESFFTYERYEALSRYAGEWIVYERHITKGKPSQFVQTEQIITIAWNNNPEFEEEQDEYD